jgi:hypothetical protein
MKTNDLTLKIGRRYLCRNGWLATVEAVDLAGARTVAARVSSEGHEPHTRYFTLRGREDAEPGIESPFDLVEEIPAK